jgi:cation:H+ antiporter
VGFVFLYFGAEWLVKGSSSLARSLGVTPIVIGLTVVAFGTSAPELVVSLISSIKGKSMIAVGNVVGSNICNIALVLGLAALFQPITADKSVVKRDIPIMLAISVYLLVLSFNSKLGRIEGATLFAGIILYTFFNYYIAMRESKQASGEKTMLIAPEVDEIGYVASRPKQILLISVGIIGVVGGAQIVVESAVKIMQDRSLWHVPSGIGHFRGCRYQEGDGHKHWQPGGEQCLQHHECLRRSLACEAYPHSRRIY